MSAAPGTAGRIEALLRERLHPERIEVRDDSAAHAGHAGATAGGHFTVRIVAARFSGLKPLARQRLVNEALAPLFAAGIHALSMQTLAPGE